MKNFLFTSVLFISLFFFLCLPVFGMGQSAPPPTLESSINADGYNEIATNNLRLQWKISDGNIELILTAPTTGWISVGFDPTDKMKDANILIGYVKDGRVFTADHYGDGYLTHRADADGGGRNDIISAEGSEKAGTTEIKFVIPLDSGDSRDRPLVKGNVHKVIIAYGLKGADDYKTDHLSGRTTFLTKL